MPSTVQKKKVCIVGGGLAGGLAAIYLARRGYNVEVYERRGDTRKDTSYAGKSINLALSMRGLTALREVGVADSMLDGSVNMPGRLLHGIDQSTHYQPYDHDGRGIISVSRQKLNEVIITQAEKYPNVKVYFDQRCVHCDARKGIVEFEDDKGEHKLVKDVIICGADGAFSEVRRCFYNVPRFDYEQTYIPQGYKELCIPPTETGDYRIKPSNALHIWPRGAFMMIALPNQNKSYTCTLFLDQQSDGECFNKIKSNEDVMKFMKKYFPDAVPHMPTLLEDWNMNPTSNLVTVRCGTYHLGDNCFLLGDAAHAVVPFFGQGCNAAFEDVRILNESLDRHNDNWAAVLPEYTASRRPNCNAISELALQNFVEMRSSVASRLFLLRKALERVLHRVWPGYIPLYTMVSFTNIPYFQAQEKAKTQDVWLNRLTLVTASTLAVGVVGGAAMVIKARRS